MGNLAAIDLGSNSCRLLISDKNGRSLFSENYSVKLGEGLYETGLISKDAFERAEKYFIEIRYKLDEYNVEKYRAVATAACRKAKNSAEFIKMIKEISNIELEIIDGYEEAMLNLKGCLINSDKSKKYVVVIDIGGGSTEITLATNDASPKIINSVSIPWGARNSSEAFELQTYNELKARKLEDEITVYLDDFISKTNFFSYKNKICFMGSSGATLRVTALQHNLEKYDREKLDGLVLDYSTFNLVLDKVFNMKLDEMSNHHLIGKNRASIMVAACIILNIILKKLNALEVISSFKGTKDGIVLNMVNK